jgi:hypothetical protein
MTHVRWGVLLAGFALLVAPPTAGARVLPTQAEPGPARNPSYLTPPLIAGPALSRDGLVWAESERSGGYRLRAESPAGPRTLAQIRPALELRLDAAGARIAYARHDWAPVCARGRCPRLLADEVFSGTLDSPLERLAGCHRGEAGCPLRDTPPTAVSVAEDAVAISLPEARGIEVRNYDAADHRFPGGPYFTLAGRYLLASEATAQDSTAATIFDRITGQRFDARGAYLNLSGGGPLQADGKAIYNISGNGLAWKLPGASEAHPIQRPASQLPKQEECAGEDIALRDDVILWQYERCDPRGPVTEFVITDLAGERVLRVPLVRDRIGDVAFDGTRLAWATKTCALVSLAEITLDRTTWTTGSDFPRVPASSCPAPTVSGSDLRASRSGGVTVSVGCPANASYGCTGGLALYRRVQVSRRYRAGKDFAGGTSAALLAGGERRIRIQLRHKQFAILRRDRRMRIELDVLGANSAKPQRRITALLRAPARR